jgi:hypothetical protein
MSNLLLADYAVTTLASSFDADAGTFTVAPGTGALFPTPIGGTGTYMILTLEDEAGNTEKIKVTHRAGDVFGSNTYPIQRGYGGTSARPWAGGDSLSLRWNKTTAEEMAAEAADGAFAAHVVEADPHPQYLQIDDVTALFVERSSVSPYMQAVFGATDAAAARVAFGAMSADVVLGNYRGVAQYTDATTLSLTHAGKLLVAGSAASVNWGVSLPTPAAADIGKRFVLMNTTGRPLVVSPPTAVAPDEAILLVDNATIPAFTLPPTDSMEFVVLGYEGISGGGNRTTWIGLHVHRKTALTAGMGMDWWLPEAPDGWVFASGRTIGNASSAATERANADCEALFKALWNAYPNTVLAVSGGRGATADDDWAAGKTIALIDKRGRVSVGKDDMGGAAANRMTAAGSGVAGNTLGATGGTQTHTLTVAQMPSHTHTEKGNASNTDSGLRYSSDISGSIFATVNTGAQGGGGAHQNTQPSIVCNYILKL